MVKRKSTCGLCKPHKKWKKNDTKRIQQTKKEIEADLISVGRQNKTRII